MRNEHLNDEEIQQYILHKEECDIDMIKHIRHCVTCKIKAEQYHLLFKAIKLQEKPVFDFNLADVVEEQLPQSRYKASSYNTLFSFFIIFIAVFSLFIIFISFKHSLLHFFEGIASISVALIITTVICLIIILLIDMYGKYQKRMNALDFY